MAQPDRKTGLSLVAIRELLRNSQRILALLWRERKGLVLGFLAILLVLSASPFLFSGTRALLINELIRTAGGSAASPLLLAIILFIAVGALIPFLRTIERYLTKLFWFFVDATFELLILKKKGELDIATHEDPKHNDLFNRVRENGVWRIRQFADRQFFIVQNVIEATIAAAILLFARWWVFALILAGTIPELVIEMRYGRNVWGLFMAKSEMRRRYWSLQEHFQRIPSLVELKLFQNIPHFMRSIAALYRAFQDEEKRNERKRLALDLAALVLSQGVTVAAIIIFIRDVLHGNLQIGTLTFFLASIGDLRQALSGLFGNLGRQYQDSFFVSDVFKLLDLKPAVPKPAPAIALPSRETPEIVFQDVSFRYPGASGYALRNLSLVIPPGEKLALVGPNGAGKTTIVKLLCRFYDPNEGRILVAGRDLRTVDLESWYEMLGALFQDYSNYHFMVKEAIGIGRTQKPHSLQEVKRAARQSEAHEFIELWDKQYEQMLGKQFTGGAEPSIGQWQKLALARTFYRDPRVFILDEPTSSIDAEAEAAIFEKLEQLPQDRTVILISHRFSTVRQAHRICVLEEGQQTEYGTHEELLARGGTYARLFKLQAKGYR